MYDNPYDSDFIGDSENEERFADGVEIHSNERTKDEDRDSESDRETLSAVGLEDDLNANVGVTLPQDDNVKVPSP